MRSRVPTLALLAIAVLALLLPKDAAAQPYDVSWWTVDGGGGSSAGGPYVLTGTAGQPDAGGPFAGSPYGLHSGFWSLAAGGGIGPQADLSITKTDGQASSVPGLPITYTIVAGNGGPSAVTAATVSDTPPASLTGVTWTCTASSGSSCPASGSGPIGASVNLLVNGTATFAMTGTVAPGATGSIANTASISAPAGVLDPAAANNAATDTNTLAAQADLGASLSDSPDPVGQGASLTYTIQATNLGPSTSPSMTITDTLPAQVTFVSATPTFPTCMHVAGVVTCTLATTLAPNASTTVTLQVTVSPTATGTLSNTATVSGGAIDPVSANNTDVETTLVVARSDGELRHGTAERFDLAALPGPIADEDRFRIRQQPFSSYEVIVDETSGDIGTGNGPNLERVDVNGTTVLQTSEPAGSGPSRSLRWENSSSSAVDDQTIRVRSASCSTDCGVDDAYRIRAYDTTYSLPRFNNSGTQVTVLLLQNTGVTTVNGHVYFWSPTGALLATHAFVLSPKQLLVLNAATVGGLAGQSGTMTVGHDGPYGVLAGKTVALEPATGFSFDSPMEVKRR
jgi:uncharacterized repeat protein (TIGR01451 family)